MPAKKKSSKIPANLRALMKEQMPPALREYFAKTGAQGGAAGTGEAKRRGGSEFYRKLAAKRKQKK